MRKRPITEVREALALAFIATHLRQTGYPPSVREIGGAAGLRSSSGALRIVVGLEDAGLIERDMTRARAIRLTDQGKRIAGVL